MEFVSKQQTYEAIRKLLLETGARTGDPNFEEIARQMQMDGDHSKSPELYQRFLDTLRSDPLSPQNALDAAAQFLEENIPPDGNPETVRLIEAAKTTAQDPETGDLSFWNHWVTLLESV